MPGSRLRRLGKVLHMSKSGNLILRLEQPPVPQEYSRVVDYKMKTVGVINNILGPVKNPYVSVKPEGIVSDLSGRVLYLFEEN
jgi:rRNA processing protein Gar1